MNFNMQALTALLVILATNVHSHSWIEELRLIAPNGTFSGDSGFPRGNVARGPGFNDTFMTNLIPPNKQGNNTILDTTPICAPTQQPYNQTAGSPRLQAPPGAAIALQYRENGHVTIRAQLNKPLNSGTVYVYGTTDPRVNDTLLSIHNVWNGDGTGGDRRGLLLSVQNFDDGRCYQVNTFDLSKARQEEFPFDGQELRCQQDIALPTNISTGHPYTLYWVWDWPTLKSNQVTMNEIYTTCMDVDVVNGQTAGTNDQKMYVTQTSYGIAAIPSEFANLRNAVSTASTEPVSPDASTTMKCNMSPTPTSPPAPMGTTTSSLSPSLSDQKTPCTSASLSTTTVTITVTQAASSMQTGGSMRKRAGDVHDGEDSVPYYESP